MYLTIDEASAQLQAAGRYLIEHQLAWGNAGNLSARTGPDRYVITASGTRLGELAADDLVECVIDGDVVNAGGRKPSKERPMHEAIYAARPEINAVLHASPFHSTLIACSGESVPSNLFVESMYYLECVVRVPYRHPGSTALGDVVGDHATRANILLLDNHGVLVYDTNVQEALMGLYTLEMTCRMWLAARSAGVELRGLDPNVVGDFLDHAGYKPRRRWPSEG